MQEQASGYGLGRPTGSDTASVRGLAHVVQSPRTACHTLYFLWAGPHRVKDQAETSHHLRDPYMLFLKAGCQTAHSKAKRPPCEGNKKKKKEQGKNKRKSK